VVRPCEHVYEPSVSIKVGIILEQLWTANLLKQGFRNPRPADMFVRPAYDFYNTVSIFLMENS
jgi:hypothetical protein